MVEYTINWNMLYFYCFRRILSYCVVAGGDGELLRNQVKRAGAVGGGRWTHTHLRYSSCAGLQRECNLDTIIVEYEIWFMRWHCTSEINAMYDLFDTERDERENEIIAC